MTKDEAIEVMKQGKKVRHQYFSQDEWMKQDDERPRYYRFEDGVVCSPEEFWRFRQEKAFETDWEIVE